MLEEAGARTRAEADSTVELVAVFMAADTVADTMADMAATTADTLAADTPAVAPMLARAATTAALTGLRRPIPGPGKAIARATHRRDGISFHQGVLGALALQHLPLVPSHLRRQVAR